MALDLDTEDVQLHATTSETALGNAVAMPKRRVRGDHDLLKALLKPDVPLRDAGVLVPIVLHDSGLTVILTQRTSHLTDHAGQISFPGGRVEECDPDITACALRETEEEIGLPSRFVQIIGRLDTYITGTGYRVTPIIGLVTPPYPVERDAFEVEEVFEVPLSFIVDPANHERRSGETRGIKRQFYVLPYQNRYIWGATAGMLVNLAEVLSPPT